MEVKNDDPNPKPLEFREKEMKTCRGFSYFSSARYAESKNPICLGFSDSIKISVHKEPVLSQPAKLTESKTSKDIPISLGISDSTKISVHEEPVPSQPTELTESETLKDIHMLSGFKFACVGNAHYRGPPDDSGRVHLSLECSGLQILTEQWANPEPNTEEHKHGTNPQSQRYNKPGPTTEESYLYRQGKISSINILTSIVASGIYRNFCKGYEDMKKDIDSILERYRRPPK